MASRYPLYKLADNYDEWWNVKTMAEKKRSFKFQYDSIREPRQIWNADLREYHLCTYVPKVYSLFYNPVNSSEATLAQLAARLA